MPHHEDGDYAEDTTMVVRRARREALLEDPTRAEHSEDVPMDAPLDKVGIAAILTFVGRQSAVGGGEQIGRVYIRAKIERIICCEAWWQVRQVLHPSLWREFYDHIDRITKTPATAGVRTWHDTHGWGM